MKTKIALLVTSFILCGAGYLLLHYYEWFGYCLGEVAFLPPNGREVCWNDFSDFGWPLVTIGTYLFPIAFLLFFSRESIVSVWWRTFGVWFVPLWIILFLVVNNNASEFKYLIMDSNVFAAQLGTMFLIISTLIIFFSNRKKSS